MGMKLNLSCMNIKKQFNWETNSYSCYMRNMPHWALHASFLSFQIHKQSCFAFTERLCCTCPSVFSSNSGRRRVSLAVLSLWGTMRAGSQVRQTRYKDSQAWVTSQRSLKVSIIPSDAYIHLGKKKTSSEVWCLWNTWTQCVKLPTACVTHLFTNNLVTPKPVYNSLC